MAALVRTESAREELRSAEGGKHNLIFSDLSEATKLMSEKEILAIDFKAMCEKDSVIAFRTRTTIDEDNSELLFEIAKRNDFGLRSILSWIELGGDYIEIQKFCLMTCGKGLPIERERHQFKRIHHQGGQKVKNRLFFRKSIARLYPKCWNGETTTRLELFGGDGTEGWATWNSQSGDAKASGRSA